MKLKSVKSDYQKNQIEQYTKIGSPVQTRADSEPMNPDPMQNDRINIHKTKINTGSNSKKNDRESEYIIK